MQFFDSFQEEEDMPDEVELYPIIITTYIKPKKRVTMLEPETLLSEKSDLSNFEDTIDTNTKKAVDRVAGFPQIAEESNRRRLSDIFKRSTSSKRQFDLEQPTIVIKERGFPGQLTKEELAECVSILQKIVLFFTSLSDDCSSLLLSTIAHRFCCQLL
jgi:hypothetical protein